MQRVRHTHTTGNDVPLQHILSLIKRYKCISLKLSYVSLYCIRIFTCFYINQIHFVDKTRLEQSIFDIFFVKILLQFLDIGLV